MLVLWRVQNAKNPYPNGGSWNYFFWPPSKDLAFFTSHKNHKSLNLLQNLYIANRTWVDAALLIPSEIARGPKKNKWKNQKSRNNHHLMPLLCMLHKWIVMVYHYWPWCKAKPQGLRVFPKIKGRKKRRKLAGHVFSELSTTYGLYIRHEEKVAMNRKALGENFLSIWRVDVVVSFLFSNKDFPRYKVPSKCKGNLSQVLYKKGKERDTLTHQAKYGPS